MSIGRAGFCSFEPGCNWCAHGRRHLPEVALYDRYREALERALIELRGTTAEGGDAEAIIRSALDTEAPA